MLNWLIDIGVVGAFAFLLLVLPQFIEQWLT